MSYHNYVISSRATWRKLIQHNICALPVKISEICKVEGIIVLSYQCQKGKQLISDYQLEKSTSGNDGFSIIIRGQKFIFYNEGCVVGRQRFTVAHEYGHYVRGHVSEVPTYRNREPRETDDPIETAANIVASRILAPACVLWGLDVHAAEDIACLCNISLEAAQWRMKRLDELYAREQEFLTTRGYSCFLLSDLEKQVYRQFGDYIKDQGYLRR